MPMPTQHPASSSFVSQIMASAPAFGLHGKAAANQPAQLDIFDMLEMGQSREFMAHECAQPHSGGGWRRCFVKKMPKTLGRSFEFYAEDSNEFLLSAIEKDDKFYISTYKIGSEEAKSDRYCYSLDRSKTNQRAFELNRLAYGEGNSSPREVNQPLVKIRHAHRIEPDAGSEMRDTIVDVLPLQGIDQARAGDKIETLRMVTKLPEWSEDMGSLVQRFVGDRVRLSSSKNFLMTAAASDEKHGRVLQFGKKNKGEYALDMRYPLAPIQAFAICLTHFSWSAEK